MRLMQEPNVSWIWISTGTCVIRSSDSTAARTKTRTVTTGECTSWLMQAQNSHEPMQIALTPAGFWNEFRNAENSQRLIASRRRRRQQPKSQLSSTRKFTTCSNCKIQIFFGSDRVKFWERALSARLFDSFVQTLRRWKRRARMDRRCK